MPRFLIVATLVSMAIAGAVAFYRRRTSHVIEYEVHPPIPSSHEADDELDQQIPDYYGGDRLGQTSGLQHYPAPS